MLLKRILKRILKRVRLVLEVEEGMAVREGDIFQCVRPVRE